VQIPQEECLTRVERGAKFCYMSGAAITSTNRSYSGPCRRPSSGRDWPSRLPATRFGTRLLPICSRTATTSGRSKRCLAIGM
jgi:hypothetical protein